MEQRNNLVLHGTETFSRGALDNVALESGAVVLDSSAGRYLPYGSYTTPEFAMPAFCNLNVSWNASAPHNTMVEVRCRVYAGNTWTGWLSFGKWAPDYPRCSIKAQSEDGLVFLMGDTVTVATPGGGTGIQLQVNLSTNDDKATPAVRLLAAAVRPLAWEKHNGHPLNRRLYLPEYCLSAHDPSFGREMDLPLVMAALMNRYGEDILPEEVAYAMEDKSTSSTGNAAFAAAAAGCCGYPCWQAWMDLADLRAQIHDDCSIAVRVERHIRGQRDPVGVWMGLRGFGHDDAVLADFVLLNDPTADSDGAVNCTMALTDFMRYFTGRAIALRPKQREVAADLPNRVRCDLTRAEDGSYLFEQRGQQARSPIFNPSGDKPEGDVGKERALKYVIAGDPDSETPVIRTLGKYDDKHSLYQIYGQSLFDLLDCSGCVIGNYQKLNGSYHSVVLSRTEKGLKLFDPWDGFADEFTVEQIFQSGFLSNSGPGIVKWIQYVAE